MNIEKLYKDIIDVKSIADTIPSAVTPKLLYKINEIISDIQTELGRKTCRASGTSAALTAAKNILKDSKKTSLRTAIHFPWVEDGKQAFTNSYIGVFMNDPLPLEERPDDAGEPICLKKCFPNETGYYNLDNIPSIAEIKEVCITNKRKDGKRTIYDPYNLVSDVWVNPQYLLWAMQCTNCNEIKYKNAINILVLRGDLGEAVLCPVRRRG